jgi:hypothetical protein
MEEGFMGKSVKRNVILKLSSVQYYLPTVSMTRADVVSRYSRTLLTDLPNAVVAPLLPGRPRLDSRTRSLTRQDTGVVTTIIGECQLTSITHDRAVRAHWFINYTEPHRRSRPGSDIEPPFLPASSRLSHRKRQSAQWQLWHPLSLTPIWKKLSYCMAAFRSSPTRFPMYLRYSCTVQCNAHRFLPRHLS